MKGKLSLYRFLIFSLLFCIVILILNYTMIHTLISETALNVPSHSPKLRAYRNYSLMLESAFFPLVLSILIVIYNENGRVKKILTKLVMYYWLIIIFLGAALFAYEISVSISEELGVYTQLGALGYALIGLFFSIYSIFPFLNALIFHKKVYKKPISYKV